MVVLKYQENLASQDEKPCKKELVLCNDLAAEADPKEFTLGRKGLLEIEDARLSRKQVELRVDMTTKSVSVKLVGLNAATIQRAGASDLTELKKDEATQLHEGDVLFLLGNCYPFMLQGLATSKATITGEKRKQSEMEGEGVANNAASSKKAKMSHFPSFSGEEPLLRRAHPPATETKPAEAHTASDEVSEEAINQILEILPTAAKEDVRQAIIEAKGDLDQTLDLLLRKQATAESPSHPPITKINSVPSSTNSPKDSRLAPPSIAELPSDNLSEEDEERILKRKEEELANQRLIIELLAKEKEQIEDKNRSIQAQKAELQLERYMPGELEALKGSAIKRYSLKLTRGFENDAATIHFRTAESQFYRLLGGEMGRLKVVDVEYVVNPPLVKRFETKRKELIARKTLSWEETKPILCFHGTDERTISKICEKGFDDLITDRGIYFSEYANYCMKFISGAKKLLLCQVLVGKAFKSPKVSAEYSRRSGFDSHVSTDGKEIVVFDSSAVLPTYVVQYEHTTAKAPLNFYSDGSNYSRHPAPFKYSAPFFGGYEEEEYEEKEYDEEYDEEYEDEYW